MSTRLPAGKCVAMSVSFMVLLLESACSAPRHAARLADVTSAHLSSLNAEIQRYVASANESRKNDALRIASTRQYFQSIEDLSLGEVRAWRANPDDPKSKSKVAAFEALQQDAALDMASADSSLKQQGNAATALESSYGQTIYDAAQIQSIVANLQSLAKRTAGAAELQVFYDFSQVVIEDAKQGLEDATLNPNGIAKKELNVQGVQHGD